MEGFDSKYRYVLVAARRARQLQSGAPPLIEAKSRKAHRIAQVEIAQGKVAFTTAPVKTPAQEAAELLDRAISHDHR